MSSEAITKNDLKGVLNAVLPQNRNQFVGVVTSPTFSISANSGYDLTVDVTESGFKPIGVVGYEFTGTGCSYLATYRIGTNTTNNSVAIGVRNYSSSALTGMAVKLWVLYESTQS